MRYGSCSSPITAYGFGFNKIARDTEYAVTIEIKISQRVY